MKIFKLTCEVYSQINRVTQHLNKLLDNILFFCLLQPCVSVSKLRSNEYFSVSEFLLFLT